MGIKGLIAWLRKNIGWIVAITAKLTALLIIAFPIFDPPSANRCLAITVFTVLMLVSHCIPLFATAFLVPVLLVTGKVLGYSDQQGQWHPFTAKQAADKVVPAMFGPMIPVLLASCVIAACYRKYDVLSIVPFSKFLSKAHPTHPVGRLLLSMLITVLLCFFLSNISAVLIAYALISRELFNEPSRSRQKAFLVGISMAGSIGGLFSPVSSTQSIFAFTIADSALGLTWPKWLLSSIPIVILSLTIAVLLVAAIGGLFHSPSRPSSPPIIHGNPDSEPIILYSSTLSSQPTKLMLLWILFVTSVTVVLWALTPILEGRLGNMAIISFIPIITIFASKALLIPDLGLIPWDIILLDMGALALVEGAQSSGMVGAIISSLDRHIGHWGGMAQMAIICAVVLTISTFNSHTVAGLLVPPIMNAFIEHKELLVNHGEGRSLYLAAAFATSIGMGLPFSGLVNLSMFGIADRDGRRILSAGDFALVGFPLSIITWSLIVLLVPLLSKL